MSTESDSDADYHTGFAEGSGSGTASDSDDRCHCPTAAVGAFEPASTVAADIVVFAAFAVVAVVLERSDIANTAWPRAGRSDRMGSVSRSRSRAPLDGEASQASCCLDGNPL